MEPLTGLCLGCQRTLGEITAWGSASDEQKRSIWRAIEQRRNAFADGASDAIAGKAVAAQGMQ
jgi:predicted Fe-S protein YdhL (DUF1289 family)